MTFLISQGKRLQLTVDVDKLIRYWCQRFSGFHIPNIIRIGYILTELVIK